MRDPTHDEMVEFLKTQTCGEDMADDIEAAIFWFAMYYHCGQDSNLYSALSTSPYDPGPCSQLHSESDCVMMLYDALEWQYADGKDIQMP